MAAYPKTLPFLQFVKKPKDPVGIAPCPSGRHMREVRIGADGKPYQYCVGADGCGYETRARDMDAARDLISKITRFERGMSKPVRIAAGLLEAPQESGAVETVATPEPKAETYDELRERAGKPYGAAQPQDDAPTPPAQSETPPPEVEGSAPKKKKKVNFKVFGKPI